MQQLLQTYKNYRFELIALLTGASVMILEIVGARIIAPYFGTSIYVWTAIIGVILGSLALGYWYGGRVADRGSTSGHLSLILSAAAFVLLITALVHSPILEIITGFELDVRFSALLGAAVLFGTPSALIGAISPHLAKIRVTSLKTTGQSVGRLEAAGAIGSILGTFLSGYVLLGWFGSQDLMLALVVLLVGVSFLADASEKKLPRTILAATALLLLALPAYLPPGTLSDSDSAYARYQVKTATINLKPALVLQTDYLSYQSGIYRDVSEVGLPFAYTAGFIKLFETRQPGSLLSIGGGTYVVPSQIAKAYPATTVDVVEIDPALDEIARQYFRFKDLPSITLHHEDGRTYLNHNQKTYDMIFVDAYNSLSPPFHLLTYQATGRMKSALNPGGMVVANVIGSFKAGKSEYLQSVLDTFRSQFGHAELLQANSRIPLKNRQNFLLLASSSTIDPATYGEFAKVEIADNESTGRIFTDDFAPVERLTSER